MVWPLSVKIFANAVPQLPLPIIPKVMIWKVYMVQHNQQPTSCFVKKKLN
jgi:hypothetical protein